MAPGKFSYDRKFLIFSVDKFRGPKKVINKEFLQSFYPIPATFFSSSSFFLCILPFFISIKEKNSIHYESFIIIFCKQQHQTIYSKIFHKWILPFALSFSPPRKRTQFPYFDEAKATAQNHCRCFFFLQKGKNVHTISRAWRIGNVYMNDVWEKKDGEK